MPGGQAERMRVVRADFNALKVGADLPDERYLFLSDILPTAWQGVQYANLPEHGVARGHRTRPGGAIREPDRQCISDIR